LRDNAIIVNVVRKQAVFFIDIYSIYMRTTLYDSYERCGCVLLVFGGRYVEEVETKICSIMILLMGSQGLVRYEMC